MTTTTTACQTIVGRAPDGAWRLCGEQPAPGERFCRRHFTTTDYRGGAARATYAPFLALPERYGGTADYDLHAGSLWLHPPQGGYGIGVQDPADAADLNGEARWEVCVTAADGEPFATWHGDSADEALALAHGFYLLARAAWGTLTVTPF